MFFLRQGAVADEVSADLLSRLSKENSTLETDELVGIDDHVEVVVEKLNLDSTNLTMVGLHGMGGIGKTTIAKAVYNKISSRFDRCCFLENIRETQDQKRGIVIIQEKLTSDILKMDSIRVSNDDEGRKMIKDRICRFKTLIILDDVDEKFKFEDVLGSPKNFHHGSRFIITSRNIKVLGSLNENQCRLYEVGAMSQSRSLELFCKHAFKKNYPPPNYNTLVDGIVSTTGGLPLTLKVIGSMLYREELAVWQEKLEQLRGTIEHQVMGRLPRFPSSLEILRLSCIEGHEIPELDIGDLKKLKVLYLNCSKLQNITGGTFGMLKGLQELDLTYFECKNLREVIVDVGELSSLKILRTKGAREVEYETPIGLKELSTSSRISNLAEMLELEVLKIYDCEFGLDIPPMWWKVSKLKNLRIIQTNINGGGSSSNNNMITTTMLPSSLTSLQIYHCHAWLPSLVNLGNLTLLLMVDCQTICNHLDGIEGLTSLKKLRIQEVKGLARITGLTNLLSLPDCKLEQLAIFNCPDLIELHDDDKAAEVGVVVNSLRSMDIINCPQLDIGPLVRGLTKFPMLEVVWLENIKFTEHQLEGVGSLEELEYCFLKLPSLERITPLSKLKKLKQLTIAGAHGLREIEGLGELKCLEYLILPNCTSLERLWQADDRLENLKKLDIRNCRSLSVEHLSALETGGLPLTLKVIGSMLYREELAVWQEKLEQLRGTIEHQVMERLKISYDTLTNEAQQIFLDIACFFIGENKEMPSYMWSDCKFYPASNINILIQRSMIKLGDKDVFQMHDQLRDMGREIVRQENIEHPWMRSRIWSAEEGKKLIYERKGLQELDLSNFKCKNLREVMVDVGELSSLKILRTKGSREVEYETPIGLKELSTSSRISNLAEMLELEVLIIDDCKFGLDIPPMWWKVSKLKYLSVVKTYINGGGGSSNNNMITTMLPSSLTYLHINQCHAWLPSLVNLGNLTDLEMVGCQTLCNHLDGIERMTSLKNLLIYGVKGLARIIGLTDLLFSPNCKLENVIIVKCPDLIELHDDKAAEAVVVVNSLRMMNIVHCPQLDVGPLVRGLTTFPMLWVLCLENIKFTEHQLEGVGSLKELECCILKLPSLERITPLSKLQKLKELTIAGAHGLREIKGLRELKSLEYLILPNCTSLERLWHADDRMENLKKLDIRNCRSLSVEHLSALEAGLPPNVEISWPDEPLSPSTATSGRWNDTIGLSAPDP
ncbi:Disease resistance protein L6 [Linum perenne]